MQSESQWELTGKYCIDCGAAQYQMDGKYKWRPDYCPYSGGDHRVETELRIPDMEDVISRIEYFNNVINRSDTPIQRTVRKVLHD